MANHGQNASLPQEIIFIILTKLPVKSLIRFKAVRKDWKALISSSEFVKAHLLHAKDVNSFSFHKLMYLSVRFSTQRVSAKSIDLSTFDRIPLNLPFSNEHVNCEVVASCDGLLLLYMGLRTYVLWNPTTRERRMISGFHMDMAIPSCCRLYGIVYNAASDAYKIIAVARINNSREDTIITVYDCRTYMFTYANGFSYWISKNQQGAMVKEAPHWLVSYQEGVGCAIIYYDSATNSFGQVATPNWTQNVDELDLRTHHGLLCLVHYRSGCADVWVMEEYQDPRTWTRLYPDVRCSRAMGIKPLGLAYHNQVVMEIDQHKVDTYDPRTRTFSRRNLLTNYNSGFSAATYVESLVSPMQ